MANFEDYYEILQVHPSAEPEVIEAAFKRLARKYHPDLNRDLAAAERMKRINRAYETLHDPEKRKQYHSEWLRKMGTAGREKASSSPGPKPMVEPEYILLDNVRPGQVRTASFVVRNAGGPYTKISISDPDSWLRVVRWCSLTDSDELPLKAEVEAEGQDSAAKFVECIIVSLINEDAGTSGETQVKIEMRITTGPVTGQPGAGNVSPNRPGYAPTFHQSRLAGKSHAFALVLSILMGPLGLDRFYLGDVAAGFLKSAVTIGSITLANLMEFWPFYLPYLAWWITDIILIASRRL